MMMLRRAILGSKQCFPEQVALPVRKHGLALICTASIVDTLFPASQVVQESPGPSGNEFCPPEHPWEVDK